MWIDFPQRMVKPRSWSGRGNTANVMIGPANGLSADRRFSISDVARKRAAGDKTALQEYNRQRRLEMAGEGSHEIRG